MSAEVLLFIIGGVSIGLFLLWLSSRSAITVCLAHVHDGKLEVEKGGLAPRIVGDLRDIVKRPRVKKATLRVLRARGRARVEASGDLTPAQMQQIRNVIGSVPLAQLENAPKK